MKFNDVLTPKLLDAPTVVNVERDSANHTYTVHFTTGLVLRYRARLSQNLTARVDVNAKRVKQDDSFWCTVVYNHGVTDDIRELWAALNDKAHDFEAREMELRRGEVFDMIAGV